MANTTERKLKLRKNTHEIGFQRDDFPQLWGWEECVIESGRSDTALRELRGQYPDEFPTPVAVLRATPVYEALEMKAFFLAHPKKIVITDDVIRQIQGLLDGGTSRQATADIVGVHLNTVAKYANTQRI